MAEALQVSQDIRVIASNLLGNNEVKIERIAAGRDSTSYKVSSLQDEFVLRTAGDKSNYDVEHYILRLLMERGVKVPIPVAESVDTVKYPFAFSLQKKVSGESLSEVGKEFWPEIIENTGKQMRLVYENKFPGFGSIDAKYFREGGGIKGSDSSWLGYLLASYDRRTNRVKEKFKTDRDSNFVGSPLGFDQIEKLTTVVENINLVRGKIVTASNILNLEQGSLIHGDISTMHIFVNDNKLSGIIDFNDVKIGDPLYDVAVFLVETKGDYYKDLLAGAGLKFDEDKFHLYRLMVSVWKLDIRYARQSYLHQNPRILDIALEEINK